ncbi:hypothetical protein FN846DRAFT_180246 [Sphaerosporella brunnea]|uniref:MOZ protein represents a chromatin-associated acetyltransferase n=1 Tax=Sphaerosporella brunnea TaxID=1250544 RepID=A0A5J5F8E7_9PEZI|nr:hypothetical protein FN846DRAFT_180246 [Sphaerosporella brunnea]
MSFPRLTFLYPAFRRAAAPPKLRRYRHGTAVEPTQLHPEPPPSPPPPPRNDSEAEAKPKFGRGIEGVEAAANDAPVESPGKKEGAAATAAGVAGGGSRTFGPREYVHHFDTYSLVQRLSAGGFSKGQSVAIMKGIRSLLEKNMAEAQENLVSKSNIENETYLFQAASSELRNEIQNSKKLAIDQLRSERTRIQTEFDLLNQAFLAEIMTLKDELNSMFNDRKMATRAEQREMENKIQELNYKITILIGSDMKSEVEKLRWQTTRRGLIAIACLALFVVASIRVNNSSHDKRKKDKERKKKVENEEEAEGPHAAVPGTEVIADPATIATSAAGGVSLG